MSIAAIKSHFANWREWELNPIVIKELRQAVRSWAVTGMLLLFLIVLFITSVMFLVTSLYEPREDIGLGGSMFEAFLFILAGASVLFIPLYIGVRIGLERQENNPDLLYVSTLPPARIIRGKFFCGAYMALLFFSACMPFMAFTNLLRGVDLPTVLFILFYLFLLVCAATMAAIFLACLPVSRPFKVLIVMFGLVQCGWLMVPLVGLSFDFMRSGVGAMMFGWVFWFGVLSFVSVILGITGLFYVLAIALISPPSANRALPVRVYMSILWALSSLLSLEWLFRTADFQRLWMWVYPTLLLMMMALLVTVSNSDRLSMRVRRTIPQAPFRRALAFVFYNGAAGGLLWVAAILCGTCLIAWLMLKELPSAGPGAREDLNALFTFVAYAFDYALMALFIQRKFLPRRPPKVAGVMAVMLASIWAVMPSVVLFFLNKLSWKTIEGLQLGNAFNALTYRDQGPWNPHLLFAFGWLALMVLLNARWFLRQWQYFRRPTAAE